MVYMKKISDRGRYPLNYASISQRLHEVLYLIFTFIIVWTGLATAVNGDPVPPGQLEAVGIIDPSNCTATLIDDHLALTAGHCVCSEKCTCYECLDNKSECDNEVNFTVNNVTIKGSVLLSNGYGDKTNCRDFALIIFDENVSEIAHVKPIHVQNPNLRLLKKHEVLMVVGFGLYGSDCCSYEPIMKRKTNISVKHIFSSLDYFNMSYQYESNYPSINYFNRSFKYESNSSYFGTICAGDSGGPAINNDSKIVGVVSNGGQDPCQLPIGTFCNLYYINKDIFDWINNSVISTIYKKQVENQEIAKAKYDCENYRTGENPYSNSSLP